MHMYVVGVVCIRVCTYINTYAHVRGGCSVYTSVYIHQYICTCTWWVYCVYECAHTSIHMHMYVDVHTPVHMCEWLRAHVCASVI